jgi:hypothetical protein
MPPFTPWARSLSQFPRTIPPPHFPRSQPLCWHSTLMPQEVGGPTWIVKRIEKAIEAAVLGGRE